MTAPCLAAGFVAQILLYDDVALWRQAVALAAIHLPEVPVEVVCLAEAGLKVSLVAAALVLLAIGIDQRQALGVVAEQLRPVRVGVEELLGGS